MMQSKKKNKKKKDSSLDLGDPFSSFVRKEVKNSNGRMSNSILVEGRDKLLTRDLVHRQFDRYFHWHLRKLN